MILLDTHVVIWLVSDLEKLSSAAKNSVVQARKQGEPLAISCISLWEIALLAAKNRIELATTLQSFLKELELRFSVLPITSSTCVRLVALPANFPKDPADRIIGATALAEDLTLVTADENILGSGAVPTVW